jgi:hypothetical protein
MGCATWWRRVSLVVRGVPPQTEDGRRKRPSAGPALRLWRRYLRPGSGSGFIAGRIPPADRVTNRPVTLMEVLHLGHRTMVADQ